MPAGTSSPPQGWCCPSQSCCSSFPNHPKHHGTSWVTGLAFTAQLFAPGTCQHLSCPEAPPPGRSTLFQRVLPPVPPSQTSFLAPTRCSPGIFRASQGHSEAQVWLDDPSQLLGRVASTIPALRSRGGLLAAAPFPCCRVSAASPGHGARPFPL